MSCNIAGLPMASFFVFKLVIITVVPSSAILANPQAFAGVTRVLVTQNYLPIVYWNRLEGVTFKELCK